MSIYISYAVMVFSIFKGLFDVFTVDSYNEFYMKAFITHAILLIVSAIFVMVELTPGFTTIKLVGAYCLFIMVVSAVNIVMRD